MSFFNDPNVWLLLTVINVIDALILALTDSWWCLVCAVCAVFTARQYRLLKEK